MRRIETRAAAAARAGQKRAIARIADALRGQVRGFSVEASAGAVVLRGKGLVRRWLDDAGLRFAAGTRR